MRDFSPLTVRSAQYVAGDSAEGHVLARDQYPE